MPQLQDIITALGKWAPWELAESWDRVGLQVGRTVPLVKRVMVALDLNDQVLNEGLERGVDGFILHHPLFFKPLTAIDPNTPGGGLLATVIKNDLFVIAAHTNADNAIAGLNQHLAECFGLTEISPLVTAEAQLCKIVVFVPETHVAGLRSALAGAGTGEIGAYSECAFSNPGLGSFRPGANAHPVIGEPGKLTETNEVRLEMVAPRSSLAAAVKAINTVHPYEQPAIDLYPLLNTTACGSGRIGVFTRPLSCQELCEKVKQVLRIGELRVSGDPRRMVRCLAVCSGSGGSLLDTAIARGADAYLTGELGYHDFQTAQAHALVAIAAGHWGTERCFIELAGSFLQKTFSADSDWEVIPSTTIQAEPYLTM
jgi:dinuclear metal center YbgI/SA1388 family protein